MAGLRPVQLSLLGPLEMQVDGRRTPIPGPRRRAVLAVLAAAMGHTVTAETLLSEAFYDVGNPQPNTLHQHVAQLRAMLAPHGQGLERQDTGYRLNDQVCDSDVARVDRALTAIRERPDPASIAELREALSHWRGDFCADVPLPSLEARRAFYADRRLNASEILFDAELDQGGEADLAERVKELVAVNPLRERLWGQLMLAEYVSGRQADALATYQRARTTLADEGGLDPGPALRDIEMTILRQSGTPDATASVLPASSLPTLVWLDSAGTLCARPLLNQTTVVIGRSPECDIRIDWDPAVSRRHASLHRRGRTFEVTDLGSTNGTFVDGAEVESAAAIAERGTLRVGDTDLFLRGRTPRVVAHRTTMKSRRPSPPLPPAPA